MKRKLAHHHRGIVWKLVLVNVLIILAFAAIALSVAFSFKNIGSFSRVIINKDVDEVIRNAELGRDLSAVFAESDLFISTFMNRDGDIRGRADRILSRVSSLEGIGTTPKLKGAIGNFTRQVEVLFRECVVARGHCEELDALEKEMGNELSGVERAISGKMISRSQEGKDVSMLEQLSMLLLGYRESLLKISILHVSLTSKHPEAIDAGEEERILSLLRDLKLRLKTLAASEPFAAAYGVRLLRDVQAYETAANSFLGSMGRIREQLQAVKTSKGVLISAMKEADRNVSETAGAMKEKITGLMSTSGTFIVVTCGTIILCLILATLYFSYRDIKRPMEMIRRGIGAIREGDLDSRIDMKRNDEWGDIEDAMNMMADDLRRTYDELQGKNLELEITQADLENKLVDLEMEITERKRVEAALWSSEQRLHATIQSSPIPIFVIDRDLKVIYWNSALERLSGKAASEVIGTDQAWVALYEETHPTLAGLIVKGEPAEISSWYEGKYSHSRLVEGAYEVTDFFPGRGDGGKWLHITAAPLRDSSGNLIGAIETLEDISEEKHLEEQLRHSQKMEAIGQLAGGVAHDFNNILTGIMGFGNLLQLKIGENQQLRRYTDQIISSAKKGAKLTNSLLAFSRKHVVELKTANLSDIIARVQGLLTRLIREDIELRIVTGGDLTIRADALQIEQIMMNLVTNACDAMPGGGILTISTLQISLDSEFVRKSGYGEPGEYALLSVSDTGTGMDELIRERIFEPFFTSKEAGKGTGLGLSIVYGIVKQHGGYIDVESAPGKGTSFMIYLPIVADSGDEREAAGGEMALPQGSETILLADDDPVVRELTKELLQEFGYKVIDAMDGDEALDKFMQYRDEISLVILDAVMPKRNGSEVFTEMRRQRNDVKALFISGYTGDVLTRKGMLDREFELIAKPYIQSSFLGKVREILDR
jgi:PAS domain S-box-containing protein